MIVRVTYNRSTVESVDMSEYEAYQVYYDIIDKRKSTIRIKTNFANLVFPVYSVTKVRVVDGSS